MTDRVPQRGLDSQGIATGAEIFWNLSTAPPVEHAVRRSEGLLAKDGPLVVRTGQHTGRSAKDKFIVKNAVTESSVWWGKTNVPMEPEAFDRLYGDFLEALESKDRLFVADLYGGSQPEHRVRVRVINELAWHNLFIRTLLVRPESDELPGFEPEYTIIDLPSFRADPARHACRGETVIAVNLEKKIILIGGTGYAGEMKKSVFGLLNFILPPQGIMPMHCSANIGPEGDTAIFFGLSGTGKTTLSADPNRTLIGDDEHGWSDSHVFNFEGGCYAKMIRLSAEAEPEIFATTKRFGTVLENVVIDPETRELDLDDASLADIGLKRWEIGEAAGRFGGPKGSSFAWLVGRLSELTVNRVARTLARWYDRQKAYQELMSLDEHTLRDIGISRTEIPALINQMATVDQRATPAGWTLEDELVRPLRQWSRSRATAKTLNAMDDRMLSDLGMVRGDIDWASETMARRSVGAANANRNPQAA